MREGRIIKFRFWDPINKEFNYLTLRFKDQNDNPIDFMKSSVSCTIEVRQV